MSQQLIALTPDDYRRMRAAVKWVEQVGRGMARTQPQRRYYPRGQQGRGPILAKVTALHNNYVEAQRWRQAADGADPPRHPWSLDTVTLNAALPPDLQLQWYESADLTDPLDANVSLTFAAGDTPQERTVTKDDDGSDSEESQRIVPWLSTDTTNAPPVLILPMGMWVPNDADTEDVYCTHIIAGPHAWAKV